MSADLEEMKFTYENWEVPNKIILTTEKDAARLHLHLDKLREWGITVAVLPIAVSILFGRGSEFDTAVMQYVAATIAENNQFMYGGG